MKEMTSSRLRRISGCVEEYILEVNAARDGMSSMPPRGTFLEKRDQVIDACIVVKGTNTYSG